jgi:hypothetical protein
MSSTKLPRPVAVCSACHVATCAAYLIDQPHRCGEGQRGIWRSALATSNWDECRLCELTGIFAGKSGIFAGKKCDVCDGNGWVFVGALP